MCRKLKTRIVEHETTYAQILLIQKSLNTKLMIMILIEIM